MNQITWYHGHLLLILVPVVFLCGALLIRRFIWQKRTAHLLGSKKLLKHFSVGKKLIKALLVSLGLLFLVLALARPQTKATEQTVAQEGRDVLIALDVSRSMLAQDVSPSRIERAKHKIKRLLTYLTAERVSLMIFSGFALVQCPFTADMDAFTSFLDLADVESTSSGTTALDKALDEALKRFNATAGRQQKLMVLFTDGEDFSTNLDDIRSQAEELGLHIFIVGVGTPAGAPIPLYNEKGELKGHQENEDGVVITRLNEKFLYDLAQQTGGVYIHMTENDDDIKKLVLQIQRFKKQRLDDTTYAQKNEQYCWCAGISFLCLLTEWIL